MKVKVYHHLNVLICAPTFRNTDFKYCLVHTWPDQTRPDQTRPDQRRLQSCGPNSRTCVLVSISLHSSFMRIFITINIMNGDFVRITKELSQFRDTQTDKLKLRHYNVSSLYKVWYMQSLINMYPHAKYEWVSVRNKHVVTWLKEITS